MRIVLIPKNGLANRIRAIESGALFCSRNGYPYTVEWWRERDCNARFSDLFELPAGFEVKERSPGLGRFSSLSICALKMLYRLRGYIWLEDRDVLWWDHQGGRQDYEPWRRISSSESWKKRFSGVVLRTHKIFEKPGQGNILLTPKSALARKAREILEQASNGLNDIYWIGVHIRRGNNLLAKKYSPMYAFVDALKSQSERNANSMIFLATDSPDVEARLQQTFPSTLVTANKQVWHRQTPDGIRDAMVDLLCLSGCDVIFGSYWSSFSDIASRLGNVELKIIKV